MIKVGVFLAVYRNDAPTMFDRAIRSIILQEFDEAVEVRIYLGVDGPINDALEKVIFDHSKHIYKEVRSVSNKGLAATLNQLIDSREDEEFYFRMDADDFSLPTRFQTQLTYLRDNPEISILGTDITEIDSTSGIRRVVRYCSSPARARKMICRGVPVAHPSVCFRRNVFNVVPHYPTTTGNEDIAMWFACLERGLLIDNVHIPLLDFAVGPGFWGRRGAKKAFGECYVYIKGIWRLRGLSWRMIFPVLRLCLRLAPTAVSRTAYKMRAEKPVIEVASR